MVAFMTLSREPAFERCEFMRKMNDFTQDNLGEMVIYATPDGTVQTEVRLQEETLWLTQNQLQELFSTERTSIVKHIRNILETGELEESATCAKFAQVRQEGNRRVRREIQYYNLDMILSVGYRVNSMRGTQFRIWANRILKEHLVHGYTLNQIRLQEERQRISELKESILLVERSLIEKVENLTKAQNIIRILADFSQGLEILDAYDHQNLATTGKSNQPEIHIGAEDLLEIVDAMRRDFDSDVFGRPMGDSFTSSIQQVYQTFNGEELYPTIEHKAAILLYIIVKNHSFVDGNKRIAAAMFSISCRETGCCMAITRKS